MSRVGLGPDAAAQQAENGLIRRYAVKNEILTGLQERTPIMRSLMPDARMPSSTKSNCRIPIR